METNNYSKLLNNLHNIDYKEKLKQIKKNDDGLEIVKLNSKKSKKLIIKNDSNQLNNLNQLNDSNNGLIVNKIIDTSWAKEWDPTTLPGGKNQIGQGFLLLEIAKRNSGKTWVTREIVYKLRDRFTDAYIMSKTADINIQYPYDFIPKENRMSSYNSNFINNIIESQKELAIKNKKIYETYLETTKDPIPIKNNNYCHIKGIECKNILIILDDIISDKTIRKNEDNILTELAVNGRHYNINLILSSQVFSHGFPTEIRKNADSILLFKTFDEATRKNIVEYYLSIVSKKEGEKIINSITNEKDYQSIIIDTSKSNGVKNYEDFIYKYKANEKPPPSFNIGKKLFEYSNKRDLNDRFGEQKILDVNYICSDISDNLDFITDGEGIRWN